MLQFFKQFYFLSSLYEPGISLTEKVHFWNGKHSTKNQTHDSNSSSMHNFCKTNHLNTFDGTGNSDINRWSGKVAGVFTFRRQQILFSIDQEMYMPLRSCGLYWIVFVELLAGQKTLSSISSQTLGSDSYHRKYEDSNVPQSGFEPAQNLSVNSHCTKNEVFR